MENQNFTQTSQSSNGIQVNNNIILTLNQPLLKENIDPSLNRLSTSSQSNLKAREADKEQKLPQRALTEDKLKMERLKVVKESLRIYEEKWKKEGGEIEYLSEDGLQGIFKGEYREGKRYGKIKVLLEESGESYEGSWQDGIMNGIGVFSLKDGSKYEGQFKNGLKHGFGISTSADGSTYEGQWKDNIQDGYGINTQADGSTYEGNWKGGVRHGKGTLKSSDGFTYTGNFLEDKLSGAGVLVLADGTKYTGGFLKNKKHGSGVMIYPDEKKYEGLWADDKKHGKGEEYSPDGTIKRGIWKRGVFVKWLKETENQL